MIDHCIGCSDRIVYRKMLAYWRMRSSTAIQHCTHTRTACRMHRVLISFVYACGIPSDRLEREHKEERAMLANLVENQQSVHSHVPRIEAIRIEPNRMQP